MLSKPITEANYNIPDGDAGIYETVNYMWNYALRDVAEPLVKQLVKGLRGGNDLATIRNIYDWVWKRNVRFGGVKMSDFKYFKRIKAEAGAVKRYHFFCGGWRICRISV